MLAFFPRLDGTCYWKYVDSCPFDASILVSLRSRSTPFFPVEHGYQFISIHAEALPVTGFKYILGKARASDYTGSF